MGKKKQEGRLMSKPSVPIEIRFWQRVNKQGAEISALLGNCWEWTGAVAKAGYGVIGSGSRPSQAVYAHRLSWEIENGPITNPGLCVCHKCDNRLCVRPDHLFLANRKANQRDMASKYRQSKKLDPHKVRAIRNLRELGWTLNEIGSLFDVSEATTSDVINRKIWKDVA